MPYADYEKQKQQARDYYYKNKEKKKRQAREYYYNHYEKRKRQKKLWELKNKEKLRKYHKLYAQKYRIKDKEKHSARVKLNNAIKSGKVIKPEYVKKKIRCPYCGYKILYKSRTVTVKLKAR